MRLKKATAEIKINKNKIIKSIIARMHHSEIFVNCYMKKRDW